MPKSAETLAARGRAPRAAGLPGAALLGPALVAGVAYVDPGNVASNMTAGARYGYLLVWVVLVANVIAWLVQYLSAKLGVVTGQSLPELLGDRLHHRTARRAYWLQAELVAMATDIAEVIGGAVALQLLFGVPLLLGGAITGVASMLLLAVQGRRGARPFEFVVIGLLAVIALGFLAGLVVAPPSPTGALAGLMPRFTDSGSVLLATSILGATIMPHAIYAHSALTRDRFGSAPAHGATSTDRPARTPIAQLLAVTRWDVTLAMVVAGAVNVGMLLLAATTLPGVAGTDTLEGAHAALSAQLGPVVGVLFAVGLLASGLASTAVGAYAGAEIMSGLLRVRIRMPLRRLITLVPALLILGLGVDPTFALVLSQVALSFGIPFALIPLVALTAQRRTLGAHVNRPWTTIAGIVAAALLVTLNGVLLWLLLTGS
ncbi:Nramp family divalent metal transporter [Microbacterium capsulatum]|uniref:Nramp family divalent metal transporter n=1 Tax=Microbacterium capsulatum TaxID=3041921 RepID=A0ABU0XE69_9MICO|nr:Nramp family divalent metal transporter [Microbacterium sp. ASV81]MDQ4213414.1 Nramp family divalent metal transporter [Microbacterium sp. ASV81]